jgi:hypothetical protein
MATQITIPNFDFSGFYYPQLLERLIQFKRQNVPELTDESPYEPFTQFLRAAALVGHLNNVLVDLVANESTLPTAKLVETVRNMLRLIDYELSPASPAQVELVYELSRVFASSFEVISARSQASTAREGNNPIIFFEALEALTIDPSNAFSYVFSEESGVFTDHTAAVNAGLPAGDFQPWVTAAMKDAIYFGHKNVMWNKMAIDIAAAAANITGVWEFYDGNYRKIAPTTVVNLGATLQFNLTSLLGSSNRQGTKVRVMLNETTAYEDVEVVWTGSANVATTGLLGQTIPSTDQAAYTVGSDWTIIDDAVDGSNGWTVDGDLSFSVPQTLTKNWAKGAVNSTTSFWIRYRIIQVSTPTSPTIRGVKMDTGKQYVIRLATQGKTASDTPLGSSTGLANQVFETSREYFITDSEEVTVDGEPWIRVDNFLNSTSSDRHYIVELGKNDKASIIFGDGVNGKIPTIGVGNISALYRFSANDIGNVGSETVKTDKTGLSYVNKLWNPRPAYGWTEAEGANEASLEKAKLAGPASLRVKEVALGPTDVETLAARFKDSGGATVFSRSRSFEEGFGPKTIELVGVAAGGGLATAEQLAELELYFNGDQFSSPPKPKHLVANQEVTAVNYTPKAIDIVATVYGDVEELAVVNQLALIVQPEAVKDDGVTYEWEFGGEVPISRLSHEIFELDEGITKVVMTTPSANVPLASRELPTLGTVTITVIKPT